MSDYLRPAPCSLVTCSLPRRTSGAVVERLLAQGARNLMAFDARATRVHNHWLGAFVPLLNSEQSVIMMWVPRNRVADIMRQVAGEGRLRLSGAGAIYSLPCDTTLCAPDYPVWPEEAPSAPDTDTRHLVRFKSGLTAIFCIAEKEFANAICRAAVHAGSHGPTVHLCTGRGLRDRSRLLRLVKTAEKEWIQVVVNDCDAEPVFTAMANAGRIDEPGRGFIFQAPLGEGLINLASVYGPARHSASIQQIISAIDDLKGDTHWRDQSVLDVPSGGGPHGNRGRGLLLRERRYLEDQTLLACTAGLSHADALWNAAVTAGAPGAILSTGRFIQADAKRTETGLRLNRERVLIQMVLPKDRIDTIRDAMIAVATAQKFGRLFFYTHPVPRALTYLGM